MAVILTTNIHRYTGLAADIKPTTNVPVGSIFIETDTGFLYIWTGSAWVIWKTQGSVIWP